MRDLDADGGRGRNGGEQFREGELAVADDLALHPGFDLQYGPVGLHAQWQLGGQLEVLRHGERAVAELDARHEVWLKPYCEERGLTYCPRKHIEWFGMMRGT